MEILWTEIDYPSVIPTVILCIFCIITWTAAIISWKYDKMDTITIISGIIAVLMTILVIIILINPVKNEYVYVRFKSNASYTEVLGKYEYVEQMDNVYKLKVIIK